MNDLWVHYSGKANSDMDQQILDVVEASGGKWFGSGMHFLDGDRDNSFTFDTHADFEAAVGGLSKAFELKWMRTTGEEGSYSCHYKVS